MEGRDEGKGLVFRLRDSLLRLVCLLHQSTVLAGESGNTRSKMMFQEWDTFRRSIRYEDFVGHKRDRVLVHV